GSILMTSAPKSASVLPQKGPAISWPSSMTRTPARGPAADGDGVAMARCPPVNPKDTAGRKLPGLLQLCRVFHGLDDVEVTRAAAEVAFKAVDDLLVSGVRVRLDQ